LATNLAVFSDADEKYTMAPIFSPSATCSGTLSCNCAVATSLILFLLSTLHMNAETTISSF
jgi:hypothetical protein